jgi:hypothetical protein
MQDKVTVGTLTVVTVEQFGYLGTAVTYQTSIQEEIKYRPQSGIACYHSVQNVWSSGLLSKKLKLRYTEL